MTALVTQADAAQLPLADNTVDCIVTSPPYNTDMPYESVRDDYDLDDHRLQIMHWADEIGRILKPGGRGWINVPPTMPADDTGARWSPGYEWHAYLRQAGLQYRDTIVWDQPAHDAPTAWGSWLSPNAPNLKGRHELVLLFYKDTWARGRVERNDIDPDDWANWTRNV